MTTTLDPTTELTAVSRISRDLREAARTLTGHEARYFVDTYYALQDFRIQTNNQVRALGESEEPAETVKWLSTQFDTLENSIKSALDAYSNADPVGRWARSIVGIGPVIAAGLLAHIDIEKAPTVGHIWRFAGLDPTVTWKKGEKRPWNAALKVLCWKIGESFVKQKGREEDVYGKVYETRKALEIARNEAGEYAEQAKTSLATKKFGEKTEARKHYEAGKLPPARIQLRAQRYAVKLFLSHLHDVMYRVRFGTQPPKPYIIEHGGHVHFIEPPNLHVLAEVA